MISKGENAGRCTARAGTAGKARQALTQLMKRAGDRNSARAQAEKPLCHLFVLKNTIHEGRWHNQYHRRNTFMLKQVNIEVI
jgi:hypothetical protein